jgi:hypothetical protein
MRWSIHAARNGQTRNAYISYTDNLGNGGMYARIMFDVKRIQLAQVRKQYVDGAMKLRVPCKVRNFLAK